MGFFGNIIKSRISNSYVKDAQRMLPLYRSVGPEELIETRVAAASALGAMNFLSQQATNGQDFRVAYDTIFSGRAPSKEETGILSMYNLTLMKLQRAFHGQGTLFGAVVSAGIPIWITSIRATYTVDLYPYARELWTIIGGADEAEAASRIGQLAAHTGGPLGSALLEFEWLAPPPMFMPR